MLQNYSDFEKIDIYFFKVFLERNVRGAKILLIKMQVFSVILCEVFLQDGRCTYQGAKKL